MNLRYILKIMMNNPFILLGHIYCYFKSWVLTRKIDLGGGKIKVKNTNISIIIKKAKNAKFILDGELILQSHLLGSTPIRILLSDNSILHIKGDFVIGNGVCISIHNQGKLTIGGRKKESNSGITADSTIMVFSNIEIGYDLICAPGVFISDSDWHSIEGKQHHGDVNIGNHVWIASNSNILKNSIIGDNCIIASNSKIINKKFLSDSMISGIPANVVKAGINWKREIE